MYALDHIVHPHAYLADTALYRHSMGIKNIVGENEMEDNPFFETKHADKIVRTMEEMVKTISIVSEWDNRYDNVSTYAEAVGEKEIQVTVSIFHINYRPLIGMVTAYTMEKMEKELIANGFGPLILGGSSTPPV